MLKLELKEPKRYKKQEKKSPQILWEKLKIPEHAESYRLKVEDKIENRDIEGLKQRYGVGWIDLTEVVTEAAKEMCGKTEKKVENPWMIGREEEIDRMRSRVTNAIQSRNELTGRIRNTVVDEEKIVLERDSNTVKLELTEARKDLKRIVAG